MAATNWTNPADSDDDELVIQNDAVSLCLLVNRRNRSLRVIDFRAGPTAAKRDVVIAAAKREGVEKVYTLVERDEVSTWSRLGFTREGSIPSFYKRSDAWIMGAAVGPAARVRRDPRQPGLEDDAPTSGEAASPAVLLAERTIAKARRLLKAESAPPPPRVLLAPASDLALRKAVTAAQRSGRALTGFERFGRDVTRSAWIVSPRDGAGIIASSESQACFGNSFLELLTGPRNDAERWATTAALHALEGRLQQEGAVSTFSLVPADDVALAAVYLARGYRRSGVLASQLLVNGVRKDAVLWSKKLSAATET